MVAAAVVLVIGVIAMAINGKFNKKLIKDFPIKFLLRRRTAPIAKISEISVEVKAI